MSNARRPDRIGEYWQEVCRELDATPIAAEEEHLPLRSNDYCKCYGVRFTGLGPYRLFGYLSIPFGEGPFPTLLIGPGYRSVVEPMAQGDAAEKRKRFLIFSTAARGQRNADKPFAAQFPGLMTDGIDTPESYAFRGIVADWLRAVDYLLTRPEIDRSRLAAVRLDGLPLVTAAFRPEVTHIVATPGIFYNVQEQLPDEVEDYLRLYPSKQEQVKHTLSFFDPLVFANNVRAHTLLWADPSAAEPLTTALNGQTEVRPSEHSTYKDGLYQENWISRQFGFTDTILPTHWQS